MEEDAEKEENIGHVDGGGCDTILEVTVTCLVENVVDMSATCWHRISNANALTKI